MRIIVDQIRDILHLFQLEESRIKRKTGEVKDEGMLSVPGELCLFLGLSGLGGDWNPYYRAERSYTRVLKVQPGGQA
jgi:hypothetical protein